MDLGISYGLLERHVDIDVGLSIVSESYASEIS